MASWIKRLIFGAAIIAVVGFFVLALRPNPVPADIASVDRGPIEVTIEEEGVTNIREVYKVFAPISGRVDRSALEVGDPVVRGETVIALIQPEDPPFLNQRTRRELEAAADAAQAAVSLAEAEVSRAQSELRLARSDLARAEQLIERNTISSKAFERATIDVEMREAELTQALATLNLRRSERASARARLIQPGETPDPNERDLCCVTVMAPQSGVALSIPTKSEQVVRTGALLAEIGDPTDIEIVVDLLSSDAVKVPDQATARVISWGGGAALDAVVRRVDPVGFTKVSSLGIEEQRVNTVLDLDVPREAYERLGHDYRVFVEIITRREDDALRVPLGALFRIGQDWAVFRVVEGSAVTTTVELGARNAVHAEVLSGLEESDQVVLHPSDKVTDGTQIEPRQAS